MRERASNREKDRRRKENGGEDEGMALLVCFIMSNAKVTHAIKK